MGKEIFTGSLASITIHAGEKLMNKITKNPTLVFGLGIVSGYLIHKYRKQIIANATKVVDTGKDFVLQQKENLEDIIAETKEQA